MTQASDRRNRLILEAGMLGNNDSMATLAVKDIEVPEQFHENKLGLTRAFTEEPDVVVYTSIGSCPGLTFKTRSKTATIGVYPFNDLRQLGRLMRSDIVMDV